MARVRPPAPVEVRPQTDDGDVPAWLREGPVGPEPLSALLAFAQRREEWLRTSGLTRSDLNRLLRSRRPCGRGGTSQGKGSDSTEIPCD